ncbi:MAG: antibiotic biosynthesis monooxygenase [Candidatus Hydrogenedens sp.]|nr:antibiotic biosynthesis monooxygenase [Candidatus Hydrogenedens sp.]
MVTVGMNYQVRAGQDEKFVSVFKSVMALMNDLPGHVKTHLYHDVFEPGSYVILSEWQTEADFEAFQNTEQFKKVTSWGREQILEGRPRHEVYRTGSVTGAPAGSGCPVQHHAIKSA